MAPSTATFATALPETVPNSADETTATLAGPPRYFPMTIKRDVGDELVAADGVERLAEKYEGDDDAGGDRERHAEQAVGVEIEIGRDARP